MSRPPEAVQRHPHRPPCRRVCPTFRRRPRTTGQPDRPLPAGWETPSVSSTRIITRRRGDQGEAFRKDRPPHFLRDPETKPTVAPPGAPFLTAKDGCAGAPAIGGRRQGRIGASGAQRPPGTLARAQLSGRARRQLGRQPARQTPRVLPPGSPHGAPSSHQPHGATFNYN